MGRYEHFTIGKRNLKCDNNWQELSCNEFKISKPTVFCFGGNSTISAKTANGMCKIAQNLIGLKQQATGEFATEEDVDFIGVVLGVNSIAGDGALTQEEKTEFVQNYFLPLCVNENGVPLPKEQILKNFNQITFFSHCYGSNEISDLLQETFHQMSALGINKNTANEALSEMFTVSYAPFKKCGYPSLQVIPMKDIFLENGPQNSPVSKQFLESDFATNSNGTVAYKEDSSTISILTSNMLQESMDEHSVDLVRRDENWKLVNDDGVEYGDEISKAMGYALAGSIANSIQNQNSTTFTPKPTINAILEDVKDILVEAQSSEFENIIEKIKSEQANSAVQQATTSSSTVTAGQTEGNIVEQQNIAAYIQNPSQQN